MNNVLLPITTNKQGARRQLSIRYSYEVTMAVYSYAYILSNVSTRKDCFTPTLRRGGVPTTCCLCVELKRRGFRSREGRATETEPSPLL